MKNEKIKMKNGGVAHCATVLKKKANRAGLAGAMVCISQFRGPLYSARHVCFTKPLFGCDGVWSMRRGGRDAAREILPAPPAYWVYDVYLAL